MVISSIKRIRIKEDTLRRKEEGRIEKSGGIKNGRAAALGLSGNLGSELAWTRV